MLLILFWLSAAVLFYTYVGYPLLLWLIVRLRGVRPVRVGPFTPRLTLLISAYNEAPVIRAKLENVLGLDYPAHLLDVIVISDASSDGTDDIVRGFAGRGVRLLRQEVRLGKTAGLNAAVPLATGEVLVFSDANAMYQRDALAMLARNFLDPLVGCVTGEARYLGGAENAADAGERAYWSYEIQVKRLETAVGSMVGGDGAIYAIRTGLWRPLPANAINDFLNPLQIVESGWRSVYEPAAVCYEETAGGVRTEYRRRVRIVSRSWRAVFQAPGVLNPRRVGFFAVSVISHKMLRWLSGPFALVIAASATALLFRTTVEVGLELIAAAAIAALVCLVYPPARRIAQFAVYFAIITMASMVGLLKGSVGRVSGTWSTPRETISQPGRVSTSTFAPGLAVLIMAVAAMAGLAFVASTRGPIAALTSLFWLSIVALGYVYVAYPLFVTLLSARLHRPVRVGSFEPSVCLFITANDEAAVIASKLHNALALDYPSRRLEILVASDGSVDGTNDIVRTFATRGVRLLPFPERRGKIAAINDGMASVTADIVVFSDANTFLEKDALTKLVRNFADETVGAVSGDVILEGPRAFLGKSEDLYYRYERWLQLCESQIGTMVGVDGALYAIRRELFVPPPTDTILDDMAIPMAITRAGRRVVFEPEAQAHERGSETATEEFVRKARVVAGAVQFLSRRESAVPIQNRQLAITMISHKALRWLSPFFALLAFATSIVLAVYSTWFLMAAGAQLLFLLAGVAGCSPALRRLNPIAIAHYFWLVQAAAAAGFARGVLGQQSVAWRRFQRAPVEVA